MPRLRFQNKVDDNGNKFCNVCGSSTHLYATCPVRPNPANGHSVAIYKAYQVAVENGSTQSCYEFVRWVAFYEVGPEFR